MAQMLSARPTVVAHLSLVRVASARVLLFCAFTMVVSGVMPANMAMGRPRHLMSECRRPFISACQSCIVWLPT